MIKKSCTTLRGGSINYTVLTASTVQHSGTVTVLPVSNHILCHSLYKQIAESVQYSGPVTVLPVILFK